VKQMLGAADDASAAAYAAHSDRLVYRFPGEPQARALRWHPRLALGLGRRTGGLWASVRP
jgi:hypothetical protein